MNRWVLLIAGVLGIGVVLAQVAGLSENIQGYTNWTRLNINKVTKAGPHAGVRDVYINLKPDQLLGADGQPKFPLPAGTLIVKESSDPNTLSVTTLYVMQKKSDKPGDWAWGMFERKSNQFMGGTLTNPAMCVGCHQNSKNTDWTYTTYEKR
ncbi:MAG: cytochrome P460 family protein [Thermaceae bacterium]|nr:cytochrome P460 family protein [Thermaceae bacterium]